MSGWRKRSAVLVAVAVGFLGSAVEVSTASLAKLTGGSGYSGGLSSNKQIRKQQLICDPATGGATEGESSSSAPQSGSTSVTYDPRIVTLSGIQFGPGYSGRAFVELQEPVVIKPIRPNASAAPLPGHRFFETIANFLQNRNLEPDEVETGYIQVIYTLNGGAGTMNPNPGFIPVASAGVDGVDTHSLTFDYLNTTPDTTVSTYKIYADPGGRPSGNQSDKLTGIGPDGKPFTLGPSQLSSAVVSGSLVAVPLPPAAWSGLAMLAVLLAHGAYRRKASA